MRLLACLVLVSGCSEYEFTPDSEWSEGVEQPDTADAEWQTDEWDLAQNTSTDLLFFGDTSGSMSEELETLGDLVTEFVDRLDDYADDWRLLAVTGPDGCGVNGVLGPELADYAELFAEAILTPPGGDEVDEWGLNNTTAAVELTDPGECNSGFLREDAVLHVIIISDEDDNSPGWDSGDADYWVPYVDAVLDRKDDPNLVRYSAVAGPVPDGCDGAEPGNGYAEAVAATGGEFISICSDWPAEIDVLVDASVEYSDFALSRRPVSDTLEVEVNGSPRLAGWDYGVVDNAVHFAADPPRSGDYVAVSYEVAPEE